MPLEKPVEWPGSASPDGRIRPASAASSWSRTTTRRQGRGQGHFISSLPLDAIFFTHAVRSHREIENGLHREDDGGVRKNNGPANLAVIRHAAMNVLRRSRDGISLRGMRKKAGRNNRFLLELLAT